MCGLRTAARATASAWPTGKYPLDPAGARDPDGPRSGDLMRPLYLCSLALLRCCRRWAATGQARAATDADVEQRKDVGTTRSAVEIQQNETGARTTAFSVTARTPQAATERCGKCNCCCAGSNRAARKRGQSGRNRQQQSENPDRFAEQREAETAERSDSAHLRPDRSGGDRRRRNASALSSFGRSRVDRDYRRLEVLDKAQALAERGLNIPTDIMLTYFRENRRLAV